MGLILLSCLDETLGFLCVIDEPWPIRGLALEAHKDTHDLRHKHWQPLGLKIPVVHLKRASLRPAAERDSSSPLEVSDALLTQNTF